VLLNSLLGVSADVARFRARDCLYPPGHASRDKDPCADGRAPRHKMGRPDGGGPRQPTLKLALTWKTALTIAKAMNPTKMKTPARTLLAITLVKRFSCLEISFW
jgi:hypothetical protein